MLWLGKGRQLTAHCFSIENTITTNLRNDAASSPEPNFAHPRTCAPLKPPIMAPGMSLFSVNAILILSADDGSRIFANYYSSPHQTPGGMSSVASYGRFEG